MEPPTKDNLSPRKSSRQIKKKDKSFLFQFSSLKPKKTTVDVRLPNSYLSSHNQTTQRHTKYSDRNMNPSMILQQMDQALNSQCQKLNFLFEIKLSFPKEKHAIQPKKIEEKVPIKHQRIKQRQEQDSLQCELEQQRSEEVLELAPKLVRRDSSRLLCDNYEKQDLIYSVQTLIPKITRQDLEHYFGQHLH